MNKKAKILEISKNLFAEKGYSAASVSDIVQATGYPVGTIYTYFKNKENILVDIVEEGWNDLLRRLEHALVNEGGAGAKINLLIDTFLPELFKDVDLIHIVLTEAVSITALPEKIDTLSSLIYPLLQDSEFLNPLLEDRRTFTAALSVFFLGVLNSVRINSQVSLGFDTEDLLKVVHDSVRASLSLT